MLKTLVVALSFLSFAHAATPGPKLSYPKPFWFFEATYADGRILTYPIQMEEFTMKLPYNGRVLSAEIPEVISAAHAVKKNLKRRFTAVRGNDKLSGEMQCDLSKFKDEGKEAGEAVLNFSGGDKNGTPTKLRMFCQF
ncbi:MAG: hypothetical protein ACLGG0_00305 [Bacteriovoracia bacterium]